jgi:hypothetical protein
MKKGKWILIAAAFLGVLILTGYAQKAPDLSGTWIGKTEVPDIGTDEVTLVLKKVDQGYGGTIADNQGVIAANTEIKDVAIDGDKLSFIFNLADGNLITIKLTVAGDKMTGQWEHPEGSTGAIELVRKK